MKDLSAATPPMNFERAIAPMSRKTFFDDVFEQKHVVVRREDPQYYENLLTFADIDKVLTQQVLPVDEVNLVNTGSAVNPEQYSVASGHIDPVQVVKHFYDGATVVLPGLQRRLPQLAAFCRSLETVFGCDLQTNIYLTPGGAQGFKTHYDSHDVIVLQVHGSKTWRIYESDMQLPLRSQSFTPEGFVPGKLIDEFVLRAGDMAYVPRGVVHDAIATDEDSLHITTGLLSTRWVDLLLDAISDLAHKDVAFRHAVVPSTAGGGRAESDPAKKLGDLLMRAATTIDPSGTIDAFNHTFRVRRVPLVPGQFLQSADADLINEGCEIECRPDLIFSISNRRNDDGDEIILSIYDTEIVFPAIAETTLRAALSGQRFRVGDLDGQIDEQGQIVLVRRLVREGVLLRVR